MKRSTVEVWDIAIDLMLCCGLPIPHPSFFFFFGNIEEILFFWIGAHFLVSLWAFSSC